MKKFLIIAMLLLFVVACNKQEEEVVNIPSEIEPLPDEIPFENGGVVEEEVQETTETEPTPETETEVLSETEDTDLEETLENVVVINNRMFSPMLIEVKVGDTVVFKNEDRFKHKFQIRHEFADYTVTSPGEQWNFTFEEAGEFQVYDGIFPADKNDMTVVVTE